ncbi:MAG: hypothetical protein ABEH88_00080 [Halobacteriales archaeon]|jgi:hypothetical protein
MSDATDELDFWGRQLLRQSESNPLRREMRAFIADTDLPGDPRAVRRRISDGTPLAELVDEGRNERV